jgi:hypothetical protein
MAILALYPLTSSSLILVCVQSLSDGIKWGVFFGGVGGPKKTPPANKRHPTLIFLTSLACAPDYIQTCNLGSFSIEYNTNYARRLHHLTAQNDYP